MKRARGAVPGTFVNVEAPQYGGLIGIISGDRTTFSEMFQSLIGAMANVPAGTGLRWAQSVNIPKNCNALVRDTLAGPYQWLFIMGDDHVFDPDIVVRLLAHDVDIVVPNCLKRPVPWEPVTFHRNQDGYYYTADLPAEGLTEIDAAGSAGMLIRRHVLEALAEPWFEAQPESGYMNEDVYFCEKAREAGYRIYCDPTVLLGHIAYHTVWPAHRDGHWQVDLEMGKTDRIPVQRIFKPTPIGALA